MIEFIAFLVGMGTAMIGAFTYLFIGDHITCLVAVVLFTGLAYLGRKRKVF
jgi:hypothetical protein